MNKKQSKEHERVRHSLKWLSETLQDESFLENYGMYIKSKDTYIATKIQEVNYEKTNSVDVKKFTEAQLDYLQKNTDGIITEDLNAIFFLVPLSAVIPLEPTYHSNRIIMESETKLEKSLSITIINGLYKVGKDNEKKEALLGVSFAILAYRRDSEIKEKEIYDIYTECVDYLNDFITAYKLIRHDHTLRNVTTRTLPSLVEYYEYFDKHLSKMKLLQANGHDIGDAWSKRLPMPNEFDNLMIYAEYLPTDKTAHYILRIGERSIQNICMGEYEDAVINSDRFAELVMRNILKDTLGLSSSELSEYRILYSTSRTDRAVVQTLANKLGVKGNAILSEWFNNSRKARNDITHSLEIESIDVNKALKAVEYNMKIVNLMINKSSEDYHFYQIIPDTYSTLFLNGKKFAKK